MDNKKAFQSRANRQIAPFREQTEWQTYTHNWKDYLPASYVCGR